MPPDEFEGVKDWPVAPPPHGHNRPPLEVQVVADFDSSIEAEWLDKRIADIAAAAENAPDEIATADDAGKVGDLLAQAKAATEAVEGHREIFNRPLLTATRTLKSRADYLLLPMKTAIDPLRVKLDAYVADHAEATHGEMGARVGQRTTWEFEITDPSKLPLAIRRHPDVMAAIEKVVRAHVRSGARKIAGVKIWSSAKATVR